MYKKIGIKKEFLIISSLLFFVSCKEFKTNDIIDIGEHFFKENQNNLGQLISIADSITMDSCIIYLISVPKITDRFDYVKYFVDTADNVLKNYGDVKISEANKDNIRNRLPKNVTEFHFSKNVYVSFELNNYYNKERELAKVVYFKDKNKFKKLFDSYSFFDSTNKNKLNEKDHWFYFYNDHWGVTMMNAFYKKTNKEFLECVK